RAVSRARAESRRRDRRRQGAERYGCIPSDRARSEVRCAFRRSPGVPAGALARSRAARRRDGSRTNRELPTRHARVLAVRRRAALLPGTSPRDARDQDGGRDAVPQFHCRARAGCASRRGSILVRHDAEEPLRRPQTPRSRRSPRGVIGSRAHARRAAPIPVMETHRMRKRLWFATLLLALAGITSSASAQLLQRKDLSYAMAKTIAEAALEDCKARGYAVAAVVVDRGGDIIVALRA